MNMRVEYHPVLGDLQEQSEITIYFNNQPYKVYERETIASALMARGIKILRYHEVSGTARGIYCNIGHCFECRVQVNHNKVVRACLAPVKDGMVVHSISGLKMEEDQNC